MKNRKLFFPLLLITIGLVFFGCKKEEEERSTTPVEESTDIDSEDVSVKISSIETDKPARSEKNEGDFEVEGTTYFSPDSVYLEQGDDNAQAKIELLINGNSNSSLRLTEDTATTFAWVLSSLNNSPVNSQDKFVYIFMLEGKYYKYNNETPSAEWGYYYLNADVSKIGFDYSNQSLKEKFYISEISKDQLILNMDGDVYTLTPYTIEKTKGNSFDPSIKDDMPQDTTTTPVEPEPTPEFLKISNSITEDTLDIFTIEANKLGGPDSSELYYLQIDLITDTDTTLISADAIYPSEFSDDTNISGNPIVMGGDDKTKFSTTIKINNVGLETPRTYRFMIVNTSLNFKSLNITN